jgi:WD40 repeat protein
VPRTLEGHSAPVSGVAVTKDGKRAVSASDDKTLYVWDLDTGLSIAMRPRIAARFADQHRIVAGDGGGRVHLLVLEEETRACASSRPLAK